jgi:hypothetical protein
MNWNKKAFRKAVWASLARVIGIFLAAGAGSIIKEIFGSGGFAWGFAVLMALTAWALIVYAEYEREKED